MTEFQEMDAKFPRDRLWPLPELVDPSGQERRVGVEVEVSGLSEGAAAEATAEILGGRLAQTEPHVWQLEGSKIGSLKVELDTALKDNAGSPLADQLLSLSREVVPVEIVTSPLRLADFPEIDRLMRGLQSAGALGSEDGIFFAFGIHLNPEVAAKTADHIVPVARAFALIEQCLRAVDPPSTSRRVLPFIDPWPRSFIDRIVEDGADWRLGELCDVYLELVATRNHGLDLLPLLEHLFPDRVRAALPDDQAKGGRPTWHYRLPETRFGAENWSFTYEWNRWALVERVASDTPLLDELSVAWIAHRASRTSLRTDWSHDVCSVLLEADLWGD